jgi:quercetin dioxygenase-like cupin family protein
MAYKLRRAEASESATIHEEWGSLTWLASQALGNGEGVTVGRVTIEPGEANPEHHHHNGEEVLYLLQGELKHWIGDEWVIMEAGDTLSIPAGQTHYAVNVGDELADMIVAYSTGDRDFELES